MLVGALAGLHMDPGMEWVGQALAQVGGGGLGPGTGKGGWRGGGGNSGTGRVRGPGLEQVGDWRGGGQRYAV